MTTLLYTHAACLEHDPGEMHVETPARLKAILEALEADDFAALDRREAPEIDPGKLEAVHPASYVDKMLGMIPPMGRAHIDADTVVSPGSRGAALRAAGACVAAVDAVAAREGYNAFCAVRPPGHHAEPDRAMGFCLFNNVAVAALHARKAHGLEKVAVIDFDVHHGNGTQAMFAADRRLFYASIHQSPLYPGTGEADETGVGNVLNIPLRPYSGSTDFRQAMQHSVIPALDAFAPDIVLISAGFDGHRDDPLAMLQYSEDDYAWATRKLMGVADLHCEGRVVSTLEGGYDLRALAASAAAHVRALMEH